MPGLFRDRDGDRVVLLGDANCGAMPRSELAAQSRVDRQRQKTGRGGHAIALHDHRPVVQRRRLLKDADQQVVGHVRVERNAALDVVAQADRSLDDDERAGLLRGHGRGRDDDLLERVVVGDRTIEASEHAEDRRPAEMHERPPDIALHQHDGREHDVADDVPDQPVEGFELKAARQIEEADERGDAHRHLHGMGAANQLQHLVDDDRHNHDVDHVPHGDGRALEKLGEPGHVRCRGSESRRRRARPAPSPRRGARARCERRPGSPP